MQLYSNNLIGTHPSKQYQLFSGPDSEVLYQQNLKNQSEDWYYRNVKIEYDRNSNGHRCKELTDIDQDNYILYAGCSFTEGIGLELEKTYPYITSELLGCDYYNLAVSGAGNDLALHNTFVWLCSVVKKPKAVIFQWPFTERLFTVATDPTGLPVDRDMGIRTINPHGKDDDVQRLVRFADEMYYFKTVELLNKQKINHLRSLLNIPIIEVCLQGGTGFQDDNLVHFEHVLNDFARDNHYGIKSHRAFSEKLYTYIQKKYDI